MKFLHDVASMQIDTVRNALNTRKSSALNDAITELVNYASNIRERRELSQNYYFTMALAYIVSDIDDDMSKRVAFNLFVKSHGYFVEADL